MTRHPHPEIDESFVARQRERLLVLRSQLIATGDAAGADEHTLQVAAGNEPQDAVDDGDRLEQQSNDESVLFHSERRVTEIDRALTKIGQGTYGWSDGNGEAIAKAHLEAIPEAVYTSDELRERELKAR